MASTRLIMVEVNLDHLTEGVFARFLYHKVTLPSPFPICIFWKKVIISSPELKSGEWCPISLTGKCLHKLFGILLHGKFVLFLPFINLIILILMQIPKYLFSLLGQSNTNLLTLLLELLCLWHLRAISFGSSVPSTCLHDCVWVGGVCVCVAHRLPFFLAL